MVGVCVGGWFCFDYNITDCGFSVNKISLGKPGKKFTNRISSSIPQGEKFTKVGFPPLEGLREVRLEIIKDQ
jgi:hypothetical protein